MIFHVLDKLLHIDGWMICIWQYMNKSWLRNYSILDYVTYFPYEYKLKGLGHNRKKYVHFHIGIVHNRNFFIPVWVMEFMICKYTYCALMICKFVPWYKCMTICCFTLRNRETCYALWRKRNYIYSFKMFYNINI